MKSTAYVVAVLALATAPMARTAEAQARPGWGRVALFGNAASTTQDTGSRSSFTELLANVTFESPSGPDIDYEYRADIRLAGYPGASNRSRRVSVYDAYAGVRFSGGKIGVRAGQMWLNDLGGLGSIGGAMVEVRQPTRATGGRWRAGLFGGLEPKIGEAGYVANVVKLGGLVAYDGQGMRRHVVGFVHVRDRGVTERSVLVFTNILPVAKRVFVYQVAEYDLRGAAVSGLGSLSYLFVNGRFTPSARIEFQGSYHRGRSIDSRSIIRDQLDGRPIDPRTIDGLRYESASGRVTVTVFRGLRIYGGYGQDRNNRDDNRTARLTYGLYASNILGSGLDLTVSNSRFERGMSGSYDSKYASLGRSLGNRIYVSGDYSSSLSVYHFTSASGFLIESRPQTHRMALSGVVNLKRGISLLATAERVIDGTSTQTRLLSGLTYRF